MRFLLKLISILAIPAAATAADSVIVVQGNISPLNIVPTFDHGYLAVYEDGGFSVYAPDGSPAMKIATRAENVDMEPDGSVAAAIFVNTPGPRTGSIWIFNPDASVVSKIATGTYLPSHVCFAPDHSIWTLGNEERQSPGNYADYFLLRHYSRSGELLGQFLSRSSFPAEAHGGQVMVGLWNLRIAGGRIGALMRNAGEKMRSLWLESDLQGQETGRWITSGGTPAAMTESGAVYAQNSEGISVLDRATGSWKRVPLSSSDILLGAEGNNLIFAVRGMNRIRRAAQP